jgi:hypothetical protein
MPIGVIQPTTTSPNIGDYRVGRGFMTMNLNDGKGALDMGNVTSAKFQVKPTLLHHYSSRVGVQIKDRSVATRLEATLMIELEEITARNMGLALLGLPQDSGSASIIPMSNPLFYATLNFTDTNVTGPQWNAHFPLVLLTPDQPFELIAAGSGDWQKLSITCDVQHDSVEGFGSFTCANFSDL